MDIKLRRAEFQDADVIRTLCAESISGTCAKDYSHEQLRVWISRVNDTEKWGKHISAEYFILAQTSLDIVGFASLQKAGHVSFLYVHKDFMRQGVANALLQDLRREAARQGFHQLTSDVSKTARPFFEAQGFKLVKENRNIIDDVEMVNYRMQG